LRPSSLRLRLLLGGSVAILAALAVAWLAMTWLFGRHVERREAEALTRVGVMLAGALRAPADPLALDAEPTDPRFETPSSGLYWQVSSASGVLRSRSLWDQGLPVGETSPSEWRISKIDGPFGRRLLVVTRRIEMTGRPVRIAVATDAAPLVAAQGEFALELAGFMAVLWLVLVSAAFVQVRLGLRPLSAIPEDLARMKRSVTERLPEARASEVAPMVAAINALADSRQADIERARRRAADLAHSLKTPLAALAAQSRLAREQGAAEAADGLDRAVEMMAAALEAELARSRAAAARERDAGERAEPAAVAERLFSVLERTDDGAHLIFSQDVPPHLTAPVPEAVLMEVLGPLLENAARHARRQVRLSGGEAGEHGLRLEVEDDGPGLLVDRAEAALIRGARLDEAGPGHGLGLSIARDLVEATNGAITLSSSALGGLRVSLVWENA